MKINTIHLAAALVLVLALTGCGGGGGSTTTVQPPPVVATPVASVPSTLVTAVTPSNYSPALQSEELAAFNLLNAERARCGFGVLAQNAALDASTKAHGKWLLVNNFTGHYETPATPFFTGNGVGDRIAATGYGLVGTFIAAEDLEEVNGSRTKSGQGVAAVRNLLNAPYHLSTMVGSYRDVGFSVQNDVDASSTFGPRVVTEVNLASKPADGPQLLATSDIATYPCAGSTGIVRQLTNESPNPVPGRNLAASPLGSSVFIAVRDGQTIGITSASMTKVSTGTAVVLRTPVTAANDPIGEYRSHQAYVAADAPLEAGTEYSVAIVGTNNGTAFTRTFKFTTAF